MISRDYKLLARAIAEAYAVFPHDVQPNRYAWIGIDTVVRKLCDAMILDNPRFDKDTFLAAITAYQHNAKVR